MEACNTCKHRKVLLGINFCRLAKKKYSKYRRWICGTKSERMQIIKEKEDLK